MKKNVFFRAICVEIDKLFKQTRRLIAAYFHFDVNLQNIDDIKMICGTKNVSFNFLNF